MAVVKAAAGMFRSLFVFFSALLAFSLPVSFFLISMSMFGLAFCWVFAPGLKERIALLPQKKWAMLLMSVILLHVLYVFKGTDPSFALDDLRIKLPLLLLPLFFSTWPVLGTGSARMVAAALPLGCLLACAAGVRLYLGWDTQSFIDTRQLGYFVSHVRLSVLLVLSLVIVTALFFTEKRSSLKVLYLLSAMVFLFYLFIMQSPTGFFLLFAALAIFIVLMQKHANRVKSLVGLLLFLGVSVWSFNALMRYYEKTYFSFPENLQLPSSWITHSGHHYSHELIEDFAENGEPVGWYQCPSEYEQEWKKRSTLPIDGKDERGQYIRFTLMRYMSSLHLHKDSVGMAKMSDKDIRLVEQGITNAAFTQYDGIRYRLYQLAYEWMNFRKGGNPSGHSVIMRLYFWQCAIHIIAEHFFTGTGSGGMKKAYADTYNQIHSPLSETHRLRAHNQWLSFAVAFGIPLAVFIVFCFVYPFLGNTTLQPLFVVLWSICLLSFFSEDTIESSVGATMTAFTGMFFYYSFTTDKKV